VASSLQRTLTDGASETLLLPDALSRRLGELGTQEERLQGRPQDLEWAVSQGQVCLLQTRPVTALPTPDPAELEVWTNESSITVQ
jgi:phosphoenolpyruvate synthase/pyruvate phosphate dikinase